MSGLSDPDAYRAATSQAVPLLDFLEDHYADVARWAESAGAGHPATQLLEAMRALDDALVSFDDAVRIALLETALGGR